MSEEETMSRRGVGFLAGGVLLLGGAVLVLANGCGHTGPDRLPADEGAIEVVDGPTLTTPPPVVAAAPATAPSPADAEGDDGAEGPPPAAPPAEAVASPETAPAPATPPAASEAAPLPPLPFQRLAYRGVTGGSLGFLVPGTVAEAVAALLDFDDAAGHRSWAEGYQTLERSDEVITAAWRFKGKMGVAPTVHLAFRPEREGDAVRIRYEVVKRAFGIAHFFGDYLVEPSPGPTPQVRITERVFIDSGLPFVNATHDDIRKGLEEDARLLQAWLATRTGAGR